MADDIGHCSECVNLGMKINSMYINEEKDLLVVLTQDLILSRFEQTIDRKLKLEESVFKINISGSRLSWARQIRAHVFHQNGWIPKP